MKRLILILFSLHALYGYAQVTFKTIVTQGPVVAGESFQVQYVLDNTGREDDFFPPDFKNFRFVSGPNVYDASTYDVDGPKKIKNVVYTLVAMKPGKFIIPGAGVRVNGQMIRSDNALIEVISKSEAISRGILLDIPQPGGDYFLNPGEDPYDKIRRNLFLKVMVDRKDCYVGQPVTATFKLYSRLISKSDIIKNPVLYGFTVQDMVGLNDKMTTTEDINGNKFDVHTIRKVQLYPLRAGTFSIDPMEVQNKVEFTRSAVNKKPEQEIIEGVVPPTNEYPVNTIVYESSMSTAAVAIRVKPTPEKGRPSDYNGATGRFAMTASVQKSQLAKNEEGDLIITIRGKGNFTQISPPVIQWPAGIEGFDAEVTDSLDHTQSPLKGQRLFRFRFVSSRPGQYTLADTNFSFFDPDSNKYKTISAPAIPIVISDLERAPQPLSQKTTPLTGRDGRWAIGLGILVLLAAIGGFLTWKARPKNTAGPVVPSRPGKERVDIAAILRPVQELPGDTDRLFYTFLRRSIWDFFGPSLGLTGSGMNKSSLAAALEEKGISDERRRTVLDILQQCETGIFTNVDTGGNKEGILEKTRQVMVEIDSSLQEE